MALAERIRERTNMLLLAAIIAILSYASIIYANLTPKKAVSKKMLHAIAAFWSVTTLAYASWSAVSGHPELVGLSLLLCLAPLLAIAMRPHARRA